MSPARLWKAFLYPWIPSVSAWSHEKRRKGLFYRWCPPEVLECQREQDRCFWSFFLRPEKKGEFLEVGGNGIIGSQTLGLELHHGWRGAVHIAGPQARGRTKQTRRCEVIDAEQTCSKAGTPDLLAIHGPAEFRSMFARIQQKGLRPQWVIVENREPDPQWCRWLEDSGYKLRFFFHDDEYYQLKSE